MCRSLFFAAGILMKGTMLTVQEVLFAYFIFFCQYQELSTHQCNGTVSGMIPDCQSRAVLYTLRYLSCSVFFLGRAKRRIKSNKNGVNTHTDEGNDVYAILHTTVFHRKRNLHYSPKEATWLSHRLQEKQQGRTLLQAGSHRMSSVFWRQCVKHCFLRLNLLKGVPSQLLPIIVDPLSI